ncbi:MAG: hypothetical protein RLZZ546_518, partial [Bacteroidota bacterium]
LKSQNVGINVTNPTAALDIDGNMRLTDGTHGEGKVLTSDASGFASWQMPQSSSQPTLGYGQWNPCKSPNLCEYQPGLGGSGKDNFGVGNELGYSLDIEGDFAIVGAPLSSYAGIAQSGLAHVYRFFDGQWIWFQTFYDNDLNVNDYFGEEVFIVGNQIFIGTPYDDGPSGANQGSVTIYRFNGVDWEFSQKLYGTDAQAEDKFGSSIDVYGNTLGIGAINDALIGSTSKIGSVSLFNFNTSTASWIFDQKIYHPSLLNESKFGSSVSLHNNKMVVGAPGSYDEEGTAHVYHKTGTSWVLNIDLSLATPQIGDLFGRIVAIEGEDIVVSAPYRESGTNIEVGVVVFYRFNGTTWQQERVRELQPNENYQNFGTRMDLSNGFLIIGSYQSANNLGTFEGKCIIYQKIEHNWVKFEEITDPDSSPNDAMYVVALDGISKKFVVGAPNFDESKGKIIFGKFKN